MRERPSAFTAELVRLLPSLERAARRLVNQRAEVEDLVQETCLRALDASEHFQGGSNMSAWLTSILRNYHCDQKRRPYLEMPLGTPIDTFPTQTKIELHAWRTISDSELTQALDSLSPPLRRAYLLFSVDRLPQREIAGLLSIAPTTVATRIKRARIQLRAFLQRDDTKLPARVASRGKLLRLRIG